MHRLLTYIRQHLTLRLGLIILEIVGVVFGVSLGILFHQTKLYVRHAAESHAMQVLDQTVQNITSIMDHAEAVTNEMEKTVQRHLDPDSLLAYTRRVVEQNPDIIGFTIAMEPGFFPTEGPFFSAYSLREGDSIITITENLDYTSQVWYRVPWSRKQAMWLDPYIDETPGFLTSSEYNFSFVKPLYTTDGKPVGVICTDMLLKWLSQAVTRVKPYPNSSAIMLGHDGRYIVHPDTAKLVRQTIFSDPDPEARMEVGALGHSMLSGQTGSWALTVDGNPAHIFYCPLEHTDWSIAIVCPDSDVFSGYNHLLNIAMVFTATFLIVLLIVCFHIIRRAIVPINQLAEAARQLSSSLPHSTAGADGSFAQATTLKPITPTQRIDTVGQLQNSFVRMQQAILSSTRKLQSINAETEQRNKELQQAYQLVREADARKTAFIQDMYHEIRTPLNIISGFTQVIAISNDSIPEEEMADITARMRAGAEAITDLTHKLTEAASKLQGTTQDNNQTS